MTHKINLPGYGPFLIFGCGHFCSAIMAMPPKKYPIKGARRCPVCGSFVVGKVFVCRSCGVTMITKSRVGIKYYCAHCKAEQAAIKRALSKSHGARCKKFSPASRDDGSKTDCAFYELVCLPKASFSGKRIVPCRGCPDYISVPLEAKMRTYDTFSMALEAS